MRPCLPQLACRARSRDAAEYVTASLFDLFTGLYPPLFDLETRDATLVRRFPDTRRRWALVPGLDARSPWISFTPCRQTWTLEFDAGNYRRWEGWNARVQDSGLHGVMRWIFYEVAHNVPPRQGSAMKLCNDKLWVKCPVAFARPLMGSLHAFLTTITRQCERAQARAVYRESHPDLPAFHTISAAELFALSPAQLQHDGWCALRKSEGGRNMYMHMGGGVWGDSPAAVPLCTRSLTHV